MNYFQSLRGAAWMATYLFFILAPLFSLMLTPHPPSRDFWTEFSAAIGYAGLAMIGLQFGLTARFRYVTEPWGEDVIYHFHRQISLVALALVIAHPVILFTLRPERLAALNLVTASWRARYASISTYALIALVALSLWRVRFRIRYETWHVTHIVLAVVAVAAGLMHMVGWSFYLSSPWKRSLWVGLTLFWLALLIYVRIVKPYFLLRRPYRVTEVRPERGDTWTLSMEPIGHPGFRLSPGQFGWLTVYGTPFKITANPFSFSSSAAASDGRVEMTIRSLGDFTSTVHSIPVGQRVYLDGPYGAFTLSGRSVDMIVLIAGGVGIAPMMSILRTLADRGDPRPVVLLYGNRDWESVTFREELDMLTSRLHLKLVYVLDNPPEDWAGESAFINAEVLRRHLPEPYAAHEYFICGPDAMMDTVETALTSMHVPMTKYHAERYDFV